MNVSDMAFDDCQAKHINPKKVKELKKSLLPSPILQDLSETFKLLGDSTRLNIIHLLSKQELCVCDLASLLNATNSLISHQLRVLRTLRLVKVRREGQMAFYSLDDDHIRHLFNEGLIHVRERE
jgi:DNA-binding transcriptional ArsR family regulator